MFKKRPMLRKRRVVVKRRTGMKKSGVRGVSSAVKKYVNKTIHSNIENKQVQVQVGDNFGNVINDPTMNVYPMTPQPGLIQISQGVGQNERTGNVVKVRKVILKYVLYQNKFDETTNNRLVPQEIQMFLGFVKNSSGLQPNATDFQNLYQYNNSVNPIFGNLQDLNQKINTDYWTVKKYWRHKLGYATTVSSSGGDPSFANYANNDFKLNIVKQMDITKHYPKILKFNDVSDTLQGQGLFFFYQAVAADGSTMAGSQTPVSILWQLDVSYEDA